MAKKSIVTELSEEQLDELLSYTPAFSDKNLANIKALSLEKINQKERKFSMKKAFATVAAAAFILATSTVAFAAVTGFDFGQLFNSFFSNPAVSEIISVDETTEQRGVEITLVSAYTDGNQLYAMLELKDLQGSRLSENMRLVFCNTYYHADVVTPVFYDEVTGIATVGVRVDFQVPVEVGGIANFNINAIFSGANRVEFEPIAFPLYSFITDRNTITREEWHEAALEGRPYADGGMSSIGEMWQEPQRLLEINTISEPLPGIDWAIITNAGFHDGLLHIQTKRTEAYDIESNSGSLTMLDRNGGHVWPLFTFIRGNYTEYVFDIGPVGNLSETTLAFVGMATDVVISGSWNFEFVVSAQAERRFATVELHSSTLFSRADIVVSPMATSVRLLTSNAGELVLTDDFGAPFLTLRDGSVVGLSLNSSMMDADGGIANFNSLYFDITQLHSITIFGREHLFEVVNS